MKHSSTPIYNTSKLPKYIIRTGLSFFSKLNPILNYNLNTKQKLCLKELMQTVIKQRKSKPKIRIRDAKFNFSKIPLILTSSNPKQICLREW